MLQGNVESVHRSDAPIEKRRRMSYRDTPISC